MVGFTVHLCNSGVSKLLVFTGSAHQDGDSDYHAEDGESGSDVASEDCALDQPPTAAPPTLEGECLKALTDGLDSVHLQEAQEALQNNTRDAASLQQHVDDLFTTNTEDGGLSRLADWRLYCMVVYDKVVPEVADIK